MGEGGSERSRKLDMSETNGNGKSRLDRIEEILEAPLMIDHEAAMARLDEMIGRRQAP